MEFFSATRSKSHPMHYMQQRMIHFVHKESDDSMQLFIHSHLALSMENQKLPEKKTRTLLLQCHREWYFFSPMSCCTRVIFSSSSLQTAAKDIVASRSKKMKVKRVFVCNLQCYLFYVILRWENNKHFRYAHSTWAINGKGLAIEREW